MSQIMISYSRVDTHIAAQLEYDLTIAGYTVWRDATSILASEQWAVSIPRAIDECELVIVLISHSSNESKWVQRECLYAIEKGKKILPVRLEDTPLPFGLLDLQSVNLFDNSPQVKAQILSQLFNILKTVPQSDSKATMGISLRVFRQKLLTLQAERINS